MRQADAATLAMVAAEVPTQLLGAGELDTPLPIADVLVRAGLAASKGEARRGLVAGGFSLNGAVIDESYVITRTDLLPGGVVELTAEGSAQPLAAHAELRSSGYELTDLLADAPAGASARFTGKLRADANRDGVTLNGDASLALAYR